MHLLLSLIKLFVASTLEFTETESVSCNGAAAHVKLSHTSDLLGQVGGVVAGIPG